MFSKRLILLLLFGVMAPACFNDASIVKGDLTVTSILDESIAITEVEEDLFVSDIGNKGVNLTILTGLESLTIVGGNIYIYNTALRSIKLPVLLTVGGSIFINRNRYLTCIDLPLLESIGGGLSIRNNTELSSASLQSLNLWGDWYRLKITAFRI